MDFISGNIVIRRPLEAAMTKGQVVLGHRHNFDHTTVVWVGALEISLLKVHAVDLAGMPTDAETDYSVIVRAGDDNPWHLILKGRHHALVALEEGTRYGCFYSHQYPQALSIENPGQRVDPPITKRDEHGVMWVRVNENIAQNSQEWIESYR